MRVACRYFGWTVATLLAVSLVSVPAVAQFDDEFEDEFDQPAEEAPAEPEAPSGGFDDFDDFDEEDEGDVSQDLADADFDDGLETETPPSNDDADDADDAAPADADVRARQMRSHNSYMGAVGGLHVVDAGSGPAGSFRVQLATEFFVASDFLVVADEASHVGGSLSLSWTIHEMVEVWASLQSYANSNTAGDPTLFQVLGDAQLGVKVFYPINDFLTVGGDVALSLLNTVGDIGLVAKSTGLGLRANFTADLRGLSNPVPFIGRFNFRYRLDNSSELTDDTERARYDNLPSDRNPYENEDRQLLTSVERFALNINRTDFIDLSLGFEVPLRVATDFFIHPLLEWQWNIPINRQGFDCLFLPGDPDNPDAPAPGADGCLDRTGIGAFPMNLTVGARILPPVDGLSFLLAADIGLTGTGIGEHVRELAPNAPFNIYLGMSYAYDTQDAPIPEAIVREIERTVEVQLPPPLTGRVRGLVLEQGAGTPIEGAIIRFAGRDLTALVTGNDGSFTTYQFDPGQITMDISHPLYNPGQCAATIPEERPEDGELQVEVRCELVALPRVGNVSGTVASADGGPVAGATITLSGTATRVATTGPDGSFSVSDLTPGDYAVRIDGEEFLMKTDSLTVVARETASPTFTLIPRPRRALVNIRRNNIQIRRQINFATNSADILPSSEPLMTEIADVLIRNPDLTSIEIQGHTDNRGRRAANQTLSQNRADSVRAWLMAHGVTTTLEARGYGDSNPLVPNITPSNRARNRRVQFIIKERAEAPATE